MSGSKEREDLEQLARAQRRGLALEFWDFLSHNKKWWLLPIVIVLGLLGVLVFIGGSGGGVFVYTLF